MKKFHFKHSRCWSQQKAAPVSNLCILSRFSPFFNSFFLLMLKLRAVTSFISYHTNVKKIIKTLACFLQPLSKLPWFKNRKKLPFKLFTRIFSVYQSLKSFSCNFSILLFFSKLFNLSKALLKWNISTLLHFTRNQESLLCPFEFIQQVERTALRWFLFCWISLQIWRQSSERTKFKLYNNSNFLICRL